MLYDEVVTHDPTLRELFAAWALDPFGGAHGPIIDRLIETGNDRHAEHVASINWDQLGAFLDQIARRNGRDAMLSWWRGNLKSVWGDWDVPAEYLKSYGTRSHSRRL